MFQKAVLHFKTADPVLYEVIKAVQPFELEAHPKPFLRLTRSIIGQQLSVKAAHTIYSRFETLFINKNIEPEGLLNISDERMRGAGISYRKISYLKDLSQKVINGNVELNKFSSMPDEIIIEELIKIKGIGRWTAEMYLIFTLGRPDVFSFGDLGLQNAIKNVYKLNSKPDPRHMEKLSIKWSPFRTYAARILWASLDNTPNA